MNSKLWNKCQDCGRIIPYSDFESGVAKVTMLTPDSDISYETWEILCKVCTSHDDWMEKVKYDV